MPWKWGVLVSVLQRNRNSRLFIKGDLLWGIGSCDFEGWEVPWFAICKRRTKVASGLIQSESKDLRTRGAEGVNSSLRAREDEMSYPSSSSEAGQKGRIPPSFVPLRHWMHWMMPIHIRKGSLLYWVHRFKCESHPETLAQTHPEIMLIGHPIASQVDTINRTWELWANSAETATSPWLLLAAASPLQWKE